MVHRERWKQFRMYLAVAIFFGLCLVVGIELGKWAAPKPVIGVVRFEGVVDIQSADHLIDILDAARGDERVAGVVLEILSPGGFSTSGTSIFHSTLLLREEKPIVISVDGLAASAAYYISVAGNRIYASANANIGNVGARGQRPPEPVLFPDEITSGPYKLSGGSLFDQIHSLDISKDNFVDNVVHQRTYAENPLTLSPETVAEARIYLGSEALALGLIDRLGSRSDAILGAAELAGVGRYQVVNLVEFLELEPLVPPPNLMTASRSLIKDALPDAVLMLDSRIPLFEYEANSELEQHLLSLRGLASKVMAEGETKIDGSAD